MAENATTIKDLDAAQPANTIVLSEEDNQLRLIKIVEKLTFAGVGGDGFNTAITATESDLNNLIGITSNIEAQLANLRNGQVPIGGIINYIGLLTAIPPKFKLCDGTNGTPDITNRFVKATVSEAALLLTGGSTDSVNVSHNHQADHNHTGSVDPAGEHSHPQASAREASFGATEGATISRSNIISPDKVKTSPSGAHNHTASIPNDNTLAQSTGVTPTNTNMPVYYKAAFVMRVS